MQAWSQVAWLDSVAARARFGRWIEGEYTTFEPFPRLEGSKPLGNGQPAAAWVSGANNFVFMKALRCGDLQPCCVKGATQLWSVRCWPGQWGGNVVHLHVQEGLGTDSS